MKTILAAVIAGAFLSSPVLAGEAITYKVEEDIEDVLFAVESEIIGKGLNIDTVNHVGEMLARTGADLEATKQIFTDAQIFNFCSAIVSRKMMEINPNNLNFCPYRIFVYSTPDAPNITIVGHDSYPDGEMQLVHELLSGIVKEALDLE